MWSLGTTFNGIPFGIGVGQATDANFAGTNLALVLGTTGIAAIGHDDLTGAGPGDVVLRNGSSLRSRNSLGTTSLGILRTTTANETELNLHSRRLLVLEALTGNAGALITYLQVQVNGQDFRIPLYQAA